MHRFSAERKREIEETKGKSGIAESVSEWQQAMDHWLELVRDCEDQVKTGNDLELLRQYHESNK